jgi:membrane dipeptidase
MNAMEWNRDLRWDIDAIRAREQEMNDKPDRANSTVSFAELRKGNIAVCFATLIARYAKPDHPLGGWNSPEQAWAQTQAQLAWYREMERQHELIQIKNKDQLDLHLASWMNEENPLQIGYILTLEGADAIVTMDHLHLLYEQGLRAVGPAHYGPGTYAYGTNSEGGIGEKGKMLLREMDVLNMVLDVTHLCDTSFWEALAIFKGPIWASHSNCRSLVNHNRQFSDDQIKVLIERRAVIGAVLDAWMLVPDWVRGLSHPSNTNVTLDNMIDHMDYICQLAGNSDHIAIGTDLDGGFGREQCPSDVATIADMQRLPALLVARGYTQKEILQVMHGNWLRKLKEVL